MSFKMVSYLNVTISVSSMEEMHKLLDCVHYPRAKAYKFHLPELWRQETHKVSLRNSFN